MPKYTAIYLHDFKGGLHLARGLSNSYDKSLQVLHSDALKSAIFVCALQLYPELGEDANGYETGRCFLESFKISSAFPFYQQSSHEKKLLHFFPKPEIPKLDFKISETGLEKKLKKVRYIEQQLFQELLQQNENAYDLEDYNLKGAFVTDKNTNLKTILEADNCEVITKSEPYQHVAISRDYGTDSVPYYVDKIYFHENAGLFFLLEANSQTEQKVLAAMRLLEDSGIGTNRNTGNGQFKMRKGELFLDVPYEGDYELNLSLYCPKKEEIEQYVSKSFYGLTKRGGYISSPQNSNHLTIRKRSIYMFTEGSLFPKNGQNRKGKIVDLKPDFANLKHPIWRDGQPIFVPMIYKK